MEQRTNKIIELKNLNKSYDDKPAVKNMSFSIKRGEFVTFLGPSGCGKTTTLRMIAGFEAPDSGTILINGKDITNLPPHLRTVNTVFQRYALFPHLNVFKNIAFGLKIRRIPSGVVKTDHKGQKYEELRHFTKKEIADKVNSALKMVDLEDYGHRQVNSLSGGQQQRVAIARALVNEPEVLLLDEPLGALDLKMRKDMQIELMNMHQKLGITFIYVTHDQEEALTMSDTIVVMRDGEIQQIAKPQTIYDEPANAFVADFIGESNIFSGTMLKDFRVSFLEQEFECVDKGFKKNEPIDVILRPEDIKIVEEGAQVKAEVITSVFKGDHFQTTVMANGNEILVHDNVDCVVGQTIGLYVKPFDIHIMHKTRLQNEYETEVVAENTITIAGTKFEVATDFVAGTAVKAIVGFNDIQVFDDESDGTIGGEVISSIYKGSYYQCIIRTDDYFDFFIDTDDDWLKGDRVGLSVAKDKIRLEKIEVIADAPSSAEQVEATRENE